MPYEFKLKKTVEFSETDTAGIVHFSNFFRYMEAAEHAFFRSLGFSIHSNDPNATIGWPRLQCDCQFKKPLRFEDEIEIHLLVREKKEKTLSYDFVIRKTGGQNWPPGNPPEEVAYGALTVICITFDHQNGKMKAASIPVEIAGKIETAPKDALREERKT